MKLKHARISWDQSGHPYSDDFLDVYFSDEDPTGESHHVFIKGNQLEERFARPSAQRITVAELGFGSGLNFLVSWKLWNQLKPSQGQLHYIAFEKYPIEKQQLEKCQSLWPEYSALSKSLIENWPEACNGCHRLIFDNSVVLDLHFGDALSRISKLSKRTGVDAWFLDGFSPDKNRKLWDQDITDQIARLSNDQATLASYSVSGNFRRSLKASGFQVEKAPGFGRKRHMLKAVFESPAIIPGAQTAMPWNSLPISKSTALDKVAIIGSGLAGCSLAYSLHLRGIDSCLFESAAGIAAGASGIPQFALRPRLFQEHSVTAEFYLQAYLFTHRLLQSLSKEGLLQWSACGVHQQQNALNKRSSLNTERLRSLYPEEILDFKNHRASPSDRADDSVDLYFPHGGWLKPAKLCEALLTISKATLKLNTLITHLEFIDGKWILKDSNQITSKFDTVILANSQGITDLEVTKAIPIESLTGQVSQVEGTHENAPIDSVLCGQRTLFPSENNKTREYLIAASYRRSVEIDKQAGEDQQNLKIMRQCLSDPKILSDRIAYSQVAIRSSTNDRIPLVGAVPNQEKTQQAFSQLAKNAKLNHTAVAPEDIYWPNLYISTGHGSNGLATCPFSAEIIASLINNEQLPLSSNGVAELNPIRFTIRGLKRQQT